MGSSGINAASELSEPSTSTGKKTRKKRNNHVTAFSQHLRSGFAFTYRLPDGSSPPSDTDPFEPLALEGEDNNIDPLHMASRAEGEISAAVQQALLESAGNLKIHLTSVVWFQRPLNANAAGAAEDEMSSDDGDG